MQIKELNAVFGWPRSFVAVALLAMALSVGRVEAISLSLEPAAQTASVGDPVDIVLRIAGLGDQSAPSLGTFDVMVSFNPAVLTFESVAFGGLLSPDLGSLNEATADGVAGTLNLFEVSLELLETLDADQPADFVLASLRFSASGAGTSALGLSDIILGDASGDELFADVVAGASVTVRQGQPMPEGGMTAPGVFLLLFTVGGARMVRRYPLSAP